MLSLHDAILADHVLGGAALLGLVAAVLVVRRRPNVRRIGFSLLVGVLLCVASLAASSTGPSGTLMRTRYGLPHYWAVSRVDPETSRSVAGFKVEPTYLVLDAAFWMALAVVVGVLGSSRRAGASPAAATRRQAATSASRRARTGRTGAGVAPRRATRAMNAPTWSRLSPTATRRVIVAGGA
jgi:hypothetical protein